MNFSSRPAGAQTITMTNASEEDERLILLQQEDALEDVHTRFILNLPDEELMSTDRIFFQLEQAWWFYDDFYCDSNPLIERFSSLKPFAKKMFTLSPLLSQRKHEFDSLWAEFMAYKNSISTFGTVLLNKDCTKIVLCQNYKGTSWTVPSGKVNQGETGLQAGARETYEETGFDPEGQRGLAKQLKQDAQEKAQKQNIPWDNSNAAFEQLLGWNPLRENDKIVHVEDVTGKERTCYICRGVPETFPFEPVARKEVGLISWHDLSNLPKKTHSVLPFLRDLKRWIKRQQHKINGKGAVFPSFEPTKLTAGDDEKCGEFQPYFSENGSFPWEAKDRSESNEAIEKESCLKREESSPTLNVKGEENPGRALLKLLNRQDGQGKQEEMQKFPCIHDAPLLCDDAGAYLQKPSRPQNTIESSCNKKEDDDDNMEWMTNWVEGLKPLPPHKAPMIFKLDMVPILVTLKRYKLSS